MFANIGLCLFLSLPHVRGDKKGDDSDSDDDAEKSKLKSQLKGQRSLSLSCLFAKLYVGFISTLAYCRVYEVHGERC